LVSHGPQPYLRFPGPAPRQEPEPKLTNTWTGRLPGPDRKEPASSPDVPNFTRVETHALDDSINWIRATVDPSAPRVFTFANEHAG